MHELEAALESAGPGRESSWREQVTAALRVLGDATAAERENATRLDSLLSDVARTQPRLRNRVRGVRVQYGQLQDAIATLQQELEQAGDASPEVADLRQRAGWVLTALRHQRARESDLIYEAYYDAFKAELGKRPERDWPPDG
ncbi:MAG TPA: hypothetical protein VG034_20955 [Acidimicrobiia bacterium]|nr:hypothetical protein [Acidimicrobiia bacterium]